MQHLKLANCVSSMDATDHASRVSVPPQTYIKNKRNHMHFVYILTYTIDQSDVGHSQYIIILISYQYHSSIAIHDCYMYCVMSQWLADIIYNAIFKYRIKTN